MSKINKGDLVMSRKKKVQKLDYSDFTRSTKEKQKKSVLKDDVENELFEVDPDMGKGNVNE